jgi:hypothetical protein
MIMAVFWVVSPCSLVEVTDVSEVLAASIRVMSKPRARNRKPIPLKHLWNVGKLREVLSVGQTI